MGLAARQLHDFSLAARTGFVVTFILPARLQPDEPVTVDVVGDAVAFTQFVSDGQETIGFYVDGDEEREACFTVTATDIADNVGEPHDVCIDLVDDNPGLFGCSQSSASSTAVFALTALLLRRRRR
jgi:hypothetical protein